MKEKIRTHMEGLFEEAPNTRKSMELKEEMTANAQEKYDDLIAEGFSEEDAYKNVVNSIGDVRELFEGLEDEEMNKITEEQRKKKAMITAISIGLYIFAGVVFFTGGLLEDMYDKFGGMDLAMLGLILAGAICIIPTCMLVYVANMYPTKENKSMVDEYKDWHNGTERQKAISTAVSTILWTAIVIIYFIISFITMAWYITWVIFLVGGCIEAIIKLIFTLSQD